MTKSWQNFVLAINVGGKIIVCIAKWYKLTHWQFTTSGDWIKEHKCRHKKLIHFLTGTKRLYYEGWVYIINYNLFKFDTKKLYHEWYGEARLRTKKKARRWQNSLTGQNQLQLSVPSSHRGSIASLDDLHLFKRSRSMCSMQLDTVSLNLDLFEDSYS